MNALRRQIAAPRTHELPRELARQSEAKRKQWPQSEANVCRHKCNPLLIAQEPIMHRIPNTNHREPAQSVCVAVCYFIVNVLDVPSASPI